MIQRYLDYIEENEINESKWVKLLRANKLKVSDVARAAGSEVPELHLLTLPNKIRIQQELEKLRHLRIKYFKTDPRTGSMSREEFREKHQKIIKALKKLGFNKEINLRW